MTGQNVYVTQSSIRVHSLGNSVLHETDPRLGSCVRDDIGPEVHWVICMHNLTGPLYGEGGLGHTCTSIGRCRLVTSEFLG